MASDERDRLRKHRKELVAEWQRAREPGVQKAEARRSAGKQVLRDVAVQGVGTVLGGAALAGLAQLAGLLPTDPISIVVTVVLTLSLAGAVLTALHGVTKPPITSDDMAMLRKLEQIDGALELLDALDEEREPDA